MIPRFEGKRNKRQILRCYSINLLYLKMSWLPEKRVPYSWWQSICLRILRCGELPKHVAFIMDGNRRFAREKNLQKIEGHIHGFEKLAETLQWCNDLGINQVTVYAFR